MDHFSSRLVCNLRFVYVDHIILVSAFMMHSFSMQYGKLKTELFSQLARWSYRYVFLL